MFVTPFTALPLRVSVLFVTVNVPTPNNPASMMLELTAVTAPVTTPLPPKIFPLPRVKATCETSNVPPLPTMIWGLLAIEPDPAKASLPFVTAV